MLLSGTVRDNLDPFGHHSTEELQHALDSCHVRDVGGITLESEVEDGGRNWSVGQKQLLCLARAFVRGSKLVCIDEATASVRCGAQRFVFVRASRVRLSLTHTRLWPKQVDTRTDSAIQATLRVAFASATVITVAHRLATIAASTRVVVMEKGRIVEVGPPQELLQNPSSRFAAMHASTES